MAISSEEQHRIIMYILGKIEEKQPSLSKYVAETFGINPTTVHRYINKLEEQGIIERIKRGEYRLSSQTYHYTLKRSEHELDDENYAFTSCLKKHISGFAPNVINMWNYVFTEMINNVIDHSAAEQVEIIVTQNYLKTSVTIMDDGIGIFRKIMDHFHFPSLEETICELFKGKLTTDQKNHSGEGIFFSSKMMDLFIILSSGKIFSCNKYDDTLIQSLPKDNFEGTCVMMELANASQKTTKDIFDRYADPDGGFRKTVIPLKAIFESDPVSRSQAKRVCNRMDRFETVEIDFDGVAWIGQGFAHQLFAVFAQEHPEIHIVPTNMCEDVRRMYKHVTEG